MKRNGWVAVVDLEGFNLGLDKNHVCDMLLCKFRCPKSNEPGTQEKIGKMLCPRETEYELAPSCEKEDKKSIKLKLKDKTSFFTKR